MCFGIIIIVVGKYIYKKVSKRVINGYMYIERGYIIMILFLKCLIVNIYEYILGIKIFYIFF